MEEIKLTDYSHGAGCGCKISPKILDQILSDKTVGFDDTNLIVGNSAKDDAAVYAFDDKNAIISTTDFFMPIVDDPFDFGAIAATNAISDIYAMGGTPIMAISILGWPVNKLPAGIAGEVISGAKHVCEKASISLAGGHSIDTPEPIFGLAVTGRARISSIKTNDKARVGSKLYLTKPLGIGILTTAQKKGILSKEDLKLAKQWMLRLNDIGKELGKINGVSAMTDVTGFGLLGHLIEICEGSKVSARIDFERVPVIDSVPKYLTEKCIPGGTHRNFDSYGDRINTLAVYPKNILCDPQTSGGLLVAVDADSLSEANAIFRKHKLELNPIGEIIPGKEPLITVN